MASLASSVSFLRVCTHVYACTHPIQSLTQKNLWCSLRSMYMSILPGITYVSGEQSNITVPAEICEQLSFSAKANIVYILMRCHFSFTSPFLQHCFLQSGVLGGQMKKDDFSRGYGSLQIGFQMPRCYLNRNVIHSNIRVWQYRPITWDVPEKFVYLL